MAYRKWSALKVLTSQRAYESTRNQDGYMPEAVAVARKGRTVDMSPRHADGTLT